MSADSKLTNPRSRSLALIIWYRHCHHARSNLWGGGGRIDRGRATRGRKRRQFGRDLLPSLEPALVPLSLPLDADSLHLVPVLRKDVRENHAFVTQLASFARCDNVAAKMIVTLLTDLLSADVTTLREKEREREKEKKRKRERERERDDCLISRRIIQYTQLEGKSLS